MRRPEWEVDLSTGKTIAGVRRASARWQPDLLCALTLHTTHGPRRFRNVDWTAINELEAAGIPVARMPCLRCTDGAPEPQTVGAMMTKRGLATSWVQASAAWARWNCPPTHRRTKRPPFPARTGPPDEEPIDGFRRQDDRHSSRMARAGRALRRLLTS